jgi:hypothetical protein
LAQYRGNRVRRARGVGVVALGVEGAVDLDLDRPAPAALHPGFSAFVGRPIAPEDKAAIEDIAAYLVKPPVSLEKLVYLDGEKAVLYRSKRMNPELLT